jgi:hypothetical protein
MKWRHRLLTRFRNLLVACVTDFDATTSAIRRNIRCGSATLLSDIACVRFPRALR